MASKASVVPSTPSAMPMTTQPLACPAPVLTADLDSCNVPGGLDMWQNWGYYSPGVCFIGYVALCTQTSVPTNGWPIAKDETVVRCVPIGYECNAKTADQRYAVSLYNDITLSAPAFEIRWRSGDVSRQFTQHPPSMPTGSSESAPIPTSGIEGSITASSTAPASEPERNTTGGISAGGIAGIVIGAGAALCAVVWTVFVMLSRRNRRAAGILSDSKDGRRHKGVDGACQLDGRPIAELESDGAAIKELASNRPKQNYDRAPINKQPVELPGDSRIVLQETGQTGLGCPQ